MSDIFRNKCEHIILDLHRKHRRVLQNVVIHLQKCKASYFRRPWNWIARNTG